MSSSYTIFANYSSIVEELVEASISENTNKVYKQGIQAFFKYRVDKSLQQLWLPPIDHVINFIAYMYERNCAFSTVKCYLSGLSFFINIHGWTNPVESFLIKKLLSGYKRSTLTSDIRRPITLQMLLSIIDTLPQVTYSTYEAMLFQCAYLLAFFALLRVSEVVSLQSDCVQLLQDQVIILIKNSKTDQLYQGSSVKVLKHSQSQILFSLLHKFLVVRHSVRSNKFFVHYNSKPLTQYQFSSMLNRCLSFLNMPTSSGVYKSHSFRIGGATHLYLSGVNESEIKIMGRWNSSAYKSYIRPII